MKKFHLLISLGILLCCASACQKKPVSPEDAAIYRANILQQFEASRSARSARNIEFAQHLTNEIVARLLHDNPTVKVIVDVVSSDDVIAFSYPGGIVVSDGLIARLPTEAMYAFTLAHELSHQILGHVNTIQTTSYSLGTELAADRRAVALLASAAYDIRAAEETVGALGSAVIAKYENFEDASARRIAIHEQIERAKWKPPGTITRRVYQEMRASLQ